jgi:hypothetical protein
MYATSGPIITSSRQSLELLGAICLLTVTDDDAKVTVINVKLETEDDLR